MNLGENIYRLRTEKNLSQGDLADALEVSRQSVSKWENNSAVPELEKLIKMAQVFGITIDELVTGETKEEPLRSLAPNEDPRVIYIERPTRPVITPAQIFGIVLSSCSLLALVLYLCIYGARNGFLESPFALCLPAAVCGILCILTKHPLLWCLWTFSTAFWFSTIALEASFEDAYEFLFLGIALVIATLFYTILLHKKSIIHVPFWLWIALAVVLVSVALLLIINKEIYL